MSGAGEGVVIVGGGQAGQQTAASLRERGYDGRVTLVGAEPQLPYHRPPLSKGFLRGDTPDRLLPLRSGDFYAKHGIELLLGTEVTAIDRARRLVVLAGGGPPLGYERLVLALGARPRRLPIPGAGLTGVFELRTRADALALREAVAPGATVVVVGGGFIGLEVAAVAAHAGAAATVVEAAPALLPRVVSRPTARWLAALHEEHGVRVEPATAVTAIEGSGGRAVAVRTATGRRLPADVVVLGVGVVPNSEPAADAGLATGDGIVVDDRLRTSDPRVFAVGDCARFPSRLTGTTVRIESVQNATDQARHAAAGITGEDAPYDVVPYFWSEQYDTRLQIAGLLGGEPDEAVRRASGRGFSVFCYRDGALAAVESVGAPGDHLAARRLLAAGTALPAEAAADPATDLRALSAAHR